MYCTEKEKDQITEGAPHLDLERGTDLPEQWLKE